jgi:hypothetical protein
MPASGWRAYRGLTELEAAALTANLRAIMEEHARPTECDSRVSQMSNEELLTIALGRSVHRLATH